MADSVQVINEIVDSSNKYILYKNLKVLNECVCLIFMGIMLLLLLN